MVISYQSIYSRFLSKVTDYDFLQLPKDDVYDFMVTWLHSVISDPYISSIFSSLSLKDEIMELTCEMSNPTTDAMDSEFITELISTGMVAAWMEPKVKSILNISQMFSGKEQKFYSQSNHLAELRGLLKDAKTDVRKMVRDRGYIHNSYIEED